MDWFVDILNRLEELVTGVVRAAVALEKIAEIPGGGEDTSGDDDGEPDVIEPSEFAWLDQYDPVFARRDTKALYEFVPEIRAEKPDGIVPLMDSGKKNDSGSILFVQIPKSERAEKKIAPDATIWGYRYAIPTHWPDGSPYVYYPTASEDAMIELVDPQGLVVPADWVERIAVLEDGVLVPFEK